jgi:hypothetical protein
MIEIRVYYDNQPQHNEWIPDYELKETLQEIRQLGLKVEVIGRVSWQRQLAQMESNPEY